MEAVNKSYHYSRKDKFKYFYDIWLVRMDRRNFIKNIAIICTTGLGIGGLEAIAQSGSQNKYDRLFEEYLRGELSKSYVKDGKVMENEIGFFLPNFKYRLGKYTLKKLKDILDNNLPEKREKKIINFYDKDLIKYIGTRTLSGKDILDVTADDDHALAYIKQDSIRVTREVKEKGKEVIATYLFYQWQKFNSNPHLKAIWGTASLENYFDLNKQTTLTKSEVKRESEIGATDGYYSVTMYSRSDVIISALEKVRITPYLIEKGVKIK